MFASTSASLSRERQVAAHFSTSAIKGKINSYSLRFISSMLCAQLRKWKLVAPVFLLHRLSGWVNPHWVVQMMLHRCCGSTVRALGLHVVSAGAPGVFQGLQSLALGLHRNVGNMVMLLVAVAVTYCSMSDSKGIKSHYSISWNCQSIFETLRLLFALLMVAVLPRKAWIVRWAKPPWVFSL